MPATDLSVSPKGTMKKDTSSKLTCPAGETLAGVAGVETDTLGPVVARLREALVDVEQHGRGAAVCRGRL